jgi:hypothetical protein
MGIVKPESLSAALDALNEALFYGRRLTNGEKEEAARWIASRQGLPGSYSGMIAPTERDFRDGAKMFTGEGIKTRAGCAHILGEEACRALILLCEALLSRRPGRISNPSRTLKAPRANKFDQRRRALAERILGRC